MPTGVLRTAHSNGALKQLGPKDFALYRRKLPAATDTKTGPNARSILSHVLESSARRTFCVWAENAPFDKKDVLKKEKGYSWSDGSSAEKPIKAWYKAGVVDLAAELAMLGAEVYGRPAQVTVDTISGRERYTDRYLTRDKMPVAVP